MRRLATTWLAAWSAGLVLLVPLAAAQDPDPQRHFERWVELLEQRVPKQLDQATRPRQRQIDEAADGIEQWGALLGARETLSTFDNAAARLDRLLAAKQRVDDTLDRTLELRRQAAARRETPTHRDELRALLGALATLIDLSGRLRYQLSDTLPAVVERATRHDQRRGLIARLTHHRSTIGATNVADWLFTDDEQPPLAPRERLELTQDILRLIGTSGQTALLPLLVEWLGDDQLPAEFVLAGTETIRALGLPQDQRPGADPELPPPVVTAEELIERLVLLDEPPLPAPLAQRRDALLDWLRPLAERGLIDDRYRVGTFEVRPGDWLLMRNPSPFNLFTDLSPGLFTHVGVVALEPGSDGKRRMVIVDLPERGRVMPATNVDIFLQRTLNYLFLRHGDESVAAQMAAAAASTIGNETEFDLNFRTDRVDALRGQPLAGRKIKTYCAGFLLLCALQTPLDRSHFFPIDEYPAEGESLANLERLGMSIGEQFISPTGALFSSELQIVGRREPMYDPRREVEEAIFDAFARGMQERSLRPAPSAFQDLRIRLAEAARENPLLQQALARAANVSDDLDLVAAARAAAVVDTLDEIAFGASGDFLAARAALRGETSAEPATQARLDHLRRRHADLARAQQAGRLTPRELRAALVEYYIQQGEQELERRFFTGK